MIVHAELALAVYCLGIGFFLLLTSPSTPVCWTFFWMFHAYFIFIPSLATYISKLSTWGTSYSLGDYQSGYMVYIAWIASVSVGYAYQKQTLREHYGAMTQFGRSNFLIAGLSLPMVLAFAIFPSYLIAERHELADELQEGSMLGYFFIGSKMLFLSAAIYALNIWKSERRPIWLAMRLLMTLLVLLVFNPLANARFVFLSAYLAVLGSWINVPKRAMIGLAVAGPLLLFFVLPLTKVMFNTEALSREASRNTKDYLVSTEFDAFQQSMNAVAYVEANGFNYGSQLLAAPLFWVPRSLFPDKPESSGTEVADFMGYIFLNLALPLYSEWYLAIGIPGVLGFGFLWGVLLRNVDSRGCNFNDPAGNVSFWRINALLLGAFSFIIYRGSLGALAPLVGSVGVGVAILWVFTRMRLR